MEKTYWWSPIVYFALHTFVSSVIFIIVALPAVGLFALVEFAENFAGLPVFAVHVFGFLEYAILSWIHAYSSCFWAETPGPLSGRSRNEHGI